MTVECLENCNNIIKEIEGLKAFDKFIQKEINSSAFCLSDKTKEFIIKSITNTISNIINGLNTKFENITCEKEKEVIDF